jgi:hypothetical protein
MRRFLDGKMLKNVEKVSEDFEIFFGNLLFSMYAVI